MADPEAVVQYCFLARTVSAPEGGAGYVDIGQFDIRHLMYAEHMLPVSTDIFVVLCVNVPNDGQEHKVDVTGVVVADDEKLQNGSADCSFIAPGPPNPREPNVVCLRMHPVFDGLGTVHFLVRWDGELVATLPLDIMPPSPIADDFPTFVPADWDA